MIMLNYIGFPLRKTATSYFIGHSIVSIPDSVKNAWRCPNLPQSELCGSGLAPLSPVVALHENNDNHRYRMMERIKKLQNLSDYFYWYSRVYAIHICYKE